MRAPLEIGRRHRRRSRFQATASVYVVFTFGSAEEFLESPQLNDTSCAISDVQMSLMNGLELLVNMRIRGYAAPFIFVTAFPDESVRARALKAGATGFLAKPFAAPSLIKCLDEALERHRCGVGACDGAKGA